MCIYIYTSIIYIYCCHASIFLSTSFLLAEVDSGARELAGLPTQSSGTTVKVCGIGRPYITPPGPVRQV